MDCRDVLLHLRGLFRTLRARPADKDARGETAATRTRYSGSLGLYINDDGDPEYNDLSLRCPAANSQPVAQHYHRHSLYADHTPHNVGLGILHILRRHRGRPHVADRLVCLEVASG